MANDAGKRKLELPAGPGWPFKTLSSMLGCWGVVCLGLGFIGIFIAPIVSGSLLFILDYTYAPSGSHAFLWYPEQAGSPVLWVGFLLGGALLGLAWLTRERTFSLRRLVLAVLLTGAVGSLPHLVEGFGASKTGEFSVRLDARLSPEDVADLRKRLEVQQALPELRDLLETATCYLHVREEREINCTIEFPASKSAAACRRVGEALEKHIEAVAGEYAAKHGLPPLKDENRKRKSERLER